MEQEVGAEGEWRKSCQTTHNVFFNITVKKIQNYPFHRHEFFQGWVWEKREVIRETVNIFSVLGTLARKAKWV